jgi:hypothetical protein
LERREESNFETGRAAAIAADRKSFDLCDDSEGLGVGKILSDPEYLKYFGYGPAVEAKKKEEESAKSEESAEPEKKEEPAAIPAAEPAPEAATTVPVPGTATEAPAADPAGTAAIDPLPVVPEKADILVPIVEAKATATETVPVAEAGTQTVPPAA